MYDKSLEQLIDAVIADGIITDQERRVVYKKAASLGIDQDEIEVYLDGRLDAIKKNSGPKSGKRGIVQTCPNCGSTVQAGNAKCPECGYAFVGVGAVSSADELDKRLRRITGTDDDADKQRAAIVSSFPIPNSREDLFEFLASTEQKAFNRHKDGEETALGKAYYEKFVEALNKAKISFPDDPTTKIFEEKLAKDKKKIRIPFFGWLGIVIALLFVSLGIYAFIESQEENKLQQEYTEWETQSFQEVEAYSLELSKQLNEIPVPTPSNWAECGKMWNDISWDKTWDLPAKFKKVKKANYRIGDDAKRAFHDKLNSVGRLIKQAHKEALLKQGKSEKQIDRELDLEFYRF